SRVRRERLRRARRLRLLVRQRLLGGRERDEPVRRRQTANDPRESHTVRPQTMNHARTLRALAQLLTYPDVRLRALLPVLGEHFEQARTCSPAVREALAALVAPLRSRDPYEIEADYVDCFDRGRSTSMLLFEHVHA